MATTSDDDATPLLDIGMPPLLPVPGAARYLCVTPPTRALDPSLFVAAPPVDLCCPICKHVPWRNAVSCTNGHLYCKECLQAWKNRLPAGKCPQCEVRLDVMVPCRGVEASLAGAAVWCYSRCDEDGAVDATASTTDATTQRQWQQQDQCAWTGTLGDAEAHFALCPYAGVRCAYDGCALLMLRRDVSAHRAVCRHRTEPCPALGCGEVVKATEMRDHARVCPKRVVQCPHVAKGCGAAPMCFDALAAHLGEACELEPVACPFAGAGCQARMLRQAVAAHEEGAMVAHNRLVMAQSATLQRQMQTLQARLGWWQAVALMKADLWPRPAVIVLSVKHAELTGAEPFVPRFSARSTRLYSEDRVVDGRTFVLDVETKADRAPDHYGLFLELKEGPVSCKIKYTMELVHHDGQATSTVWKSSKVTYGTHTGWGLPEFVPKARLAYAAKNPYVKDGYVTFKCTFTRRTWVSYFTFICDRGLTLGLLLYVGWNWWKGTVACK